VHRVERVAPGGALDAGHTKDGGRLRGAGVECVPGDHVTITLPTGETRRVPWAQVERVETSARTSQSTAAPAPKEGPLVKVHISGEPSAVLDRRPAGMETWVPACAAPCDEDLPLGDEYRLSGPGLRSSRQFRLDGSPGGRVELHVNPSSKTSWWVGAGVGGMGLVIDLYALYFVALGSAMMHESCTSNNDGYYYSNNCSADRGAGGSMRNVGLVMLIPGTVAAVVGGGMMLANWRTGITQTSGTSEAKAKPLDAFKRSAEFRGPTTETPALFVPLAAGRF
jgi:hypothetical protein